MFAEYGGLGLDYSFSLAVAEELGNINCGGIPMALGVQTDMATPALVRYCSVRSLAQGSAGEEVRYLHCKNRSLLSYWRLFFCMEI